MGRGAASLAAAAAAKTKSRALAPVERACDAKLVGGRRADKIARIESKCERFVRHSSRWL